MLLTTVNFKEEIFENKLLQDWQIPGLELPISGTTPTFRPMLRYWDRADEDS
jgi:hypothetical protein